MINLTDKALAEIKRLRPENAALRVTVQAGGCSGLRYVLAFETKDPNQSDKLTEINGLKVFIDAKSALFIKDLTIDFADGLEGTGFSFENPNATRSCGCGSSFAC